MIAQRGSDERWYSSGAKNSRAGVYLAGIQSYFSIDKVKDTGCPLKARGHDEQTVIPAW